MSQYEMLRDLVDSIHSLESKSVALTERWLNGNPERPNDVDNILLNHQTMIESLHALSDALKNVLQNRQLTSAMFSSYSYAYELAQELIQSREGCESIIQILRTDNTSQHPEFYRALFIKEQAAEKQTNRLINCFQTLH